MKYFWIPAAILSLLLGLSLLIAASVNAAVEPWRAALEEAAGAAGEDWERAERIVGTARGEWEARHAQLHVVTTHDALDTADALFAAAESAAAVRDESAFRAALAQLDAQLRVVAERQQPTLRNIL